MDEYKTSKLCSLCHDTLEKAHLLAANDNGEFELWKNRNVLRCANSACRANFWTFGPNTVEVGPHHDEPQRLPSGCASHSWHPMAFIVRGLQL
jgi:hypothetical protein